MLVRITTSERMQQKLVQVATLPHLSRSQSQRMALMMLLMITQTDILLLLLMFLLLLIKYTVMLQHQEQLKY